MRSGYGSLAAAEWLGRSRRRLLRRRGGMPQQAVTNSFKPAPGAEQPSTSPASFAPEQLSEDILDGIGEAFIALGRDWRILYFNRASERFYGHRREEAVGRLYWELYPGTVGSEFE